MAENLDSWISKQELRKKLKIKQSTLDNAISALKKKTHHSPEAGQSWSLSPTHQILRCLDQSVHESAPGRAPFQRSGHNLHQFQLRSGGRVAHPVAVGISKSAALA